MSCAVVTSIVLPAHAVAGTPSARSRPTGHDPFPQVPAPPRRIADLEANGSKVINCK